MTRQLPILLIILLAFGLRVWQLDRVPPGWRDDELIEALVISQKVLDGDWAVYYPDASGHEALYHILAAGMLYLFGPNVIGIRWLSAFLGLLTIPLTYVVGKRLFDWRVGLLAAALLTISFWSLMYSRFGIRHVNLLPLMLAAFLAFWLALGQRPAKAGYGLFAGAGVGLGLALYTYFAARGLPLILIGFLIYAALVAWPLVRDRWRGLALMFGVTALLAVPLMVTLSQQPEAEARVKEVGRPLYDALEGDLRLLWSNTTRTLNMFHSDGDDEWLYNIPFRPLFNPLGAILLWAGVLLALIYTVQPLLELLRQRRLAHYARPEQLAAALLLLWWLAGIVPGFLSIPAGSLSHTIVAQPAVYLLVALAVVRLPHYLPGFACGTRLSLILGLVVLGSVAWRDLPDYFQNWPARGMTRFLYRADIYDLTHYVNNQPDLVHFGVDSLLAGPWDRLAWEIDLRPDHPARPRWYNGERAVMLQLAGQPALNFKGFPNAPRLFADWYEPIPGETAGFYQLTRLQSPLLAGIAPPLTGETPVCFQNGLCLEALIYQPQNGTADLVWVLRRPLVLPVIPLISNPPPPGVYAGPRLAAFVHLLDRQGSFLAGDDGFWVDPESLQPGDQFLQRHWLPVVDSVGSLAVGLYDPLTGERILTLDGRDSILFSLDE
jgi:4-amino-4-deoxy-L-arabinose transferase-like glycosyltransferase